MARKIQRFLIDGPAGKLETLLEEPEGAPREACLVCHPHPLYGGTMHNKVVHRVARGLRRSGAVVLRFNFRGVGQSQGTHAYGEGEIEDARASLGWLNARYHGLPWSLAGFSFGARIILRLGCSLQGPERLIAVGLPTRAGIPDVLERCTVPKIFIQSTGDQFGPSLELEPLFQRLPEPKQLIWIDARDHFFSGGLDRLEETVYRLSSAAHGAPVLPTSAS